MHRLLRVVLALVVLLQTLQIGVSAQIRCEANANAKRKIVNLIDPNVLTCPPLSDDDERYCCYRPHTMLYYCCDAEEFIEQSGIGFILPLLVSMLVAMLVICCVCCLCCPCCFWYKRRNRGAVYNTVVRDAQTDAPPVPQHGPQSSVYQQQQYNPQYPPQGYPQQYAMVPQQNYPMMNPQDAYPPAVPPHAAPYPPAVPPHGQPMPPPYSETKPADNFYNRQAPYNPNF
ncbi:protein shisa-5-like [Neocloeon triangulifer]|uniref:protein shisa-5-like n=1 Tax=Neocloeon triangulifer TaxID=2078957 RepID=UPI00286EC9AD|nr:protein shisa-5-like [Neocloeon triangulifer]